MFTVVALLAAALVLSVLALMIALFGRTVPALIGLVGVGISLNLLPVVNWFTAAVNLLPALAGGTLCFAALVFLVRGRSLWWAAVAIVSYSVAVLAWELASLLPGYALIWVLLFHTRVTGATLRQLARRTWWVWVVLAVIGALTLLNYRLNYYSPAPPAPLGELLQAMYISLLETTLPAAIGFHDPASRAFTLIGLVAGLAFFGWLLAWTLLRSRRAWRGWLFALLGWLVPCAALVLNRVGYFGVDVARQVIYLYLPTLLIAVGVLEAVTVALAAGRSRTGAAARPLRTPQRITVAATVSIMVIAYLYSAPSTATGITTSGAVAGATATDRNFVPTLLASADDISTDRSTFSLINGVVPPGLVPAGFAPYNRLDRVLALNDPTIQLDAVGVPLYTPDDTGALLPVGVDWTYQHTFTDPSSASGLAVNGAEVTGVDPTTGVCFTVNDPTAAVIVPLNAVFTSDQLVVRTGYSVQAPTTARLLVGPPDAPFIPANVDNKQWLPGVAGQLDTVSAGAIGAVAYDSFEVGARVCLTSIAVGILQPPGGG